jgi:hypothetical protein
MPTAEPAASLAASERDAFVVLEMRTQLARPVAEEIRHPLQVAIRRSPVQQQRRRVQIIDRAPRPIAIEFSICLIIHRDCLSNLSPNLS